MFQGIGSACPYHIDSANNDLTGRVIKSNEVKELIVQLHNEVRDSIEQSTENCLNIPRQFSQAGVLGHR